MNERENSKTQSKAKEVLYGVVCIIVVLAMYAGWVNSGKNIDSFFGMTFRYPLETSKHYCWRKSKMIFSTDQSIYDKCMREETK